MSIPAAYAVRYRELLFRTTYAKERDRTINLR